MKSNLRNLRPAQNSRRSTMPHPRRRSKTALVLAGGGLTGLVYEFGVLQALSHFLGGGFSINDFDMVVGLSAGALVGSLLVNDIMPNQMVGALSEHPTGSLTPFSRWNVYRPNVSEFVQKAVSLPFTLADNLIKNFSKHTLGGNPYVHILDEILPSAIFSNHKVEEYLRRNFQVEGRTNDFRRLKKDFYVIATDLDTGDRVVFGDENHNHVPISKAVQASSAIPLFYRPVRIGRRDYVDGAIRKTLHLDIAIERGAELIICINPVVPLRNDIDRNAIPMLGHKGRYISEKGFGYVWWQMLRLLLHSRLPRGFDFYRRYYPNVDIIMIEPSMDDYKMFFHSIMDYDARITIAEHGFETAMVHLSEKFGDYSETFSRHGIELRYPTEYEHIGPSHRPTDSSLIKRQIQLAQENHSEMMRLQSILDQLDEHLPPDGPIHPEIPESRSSSESRSSHVQFAV